MTEKQKTFREKENDLKKGKKKYIERIAEDLEAQQEIEEFLNNPDESKHEDSSPIRPFS